MKPIATKTRKRPVPDVRTAGILASLRDARKVAVKLARRHRTPVVYLRAGTVVKARS
jgi:hypothetical protein